MQMSVSTSWIFILFSTVVFSAETGQPSGGQPAQNGPMGGQPLRVSVRMTKSSYEVGEKIECHLELRNTSSNAIEMPDIGRMVGKGNHIAQGLLSALKLGVVQIGLTRDGAEVQIGEKWRPRGKPKADMPSTTLEPGDLKRIRIFVSSPYYYKLFSIDEPGNYVLRITCPTSNDESRGALVASVSFPVTGRPVFRERRPDETPASYAVQKVDFYVTRILGRKGRYFANVWQIISTPEGVPALIALLESKDKKKASKSWLILTRIRSPLSNESDKRELPKDKIFWESWWSEAGSRLSPQELFHNFDSHWQ